MGSREGNAKGRYRPDLFPATSAEWGGGSVKGFRRGVVGAQVKGYTGVRLKA